MAEARKKILCIEDDRETAALIAEELVERGYEVSIAHDGREGLAAILRQMPDLVLLNEREVETLTWVARGKTSAEIAQILGLTKRTVDFHIDNARIKLGAATRTQAVIKAATGRLIEP